jgi:hypothetical protein
MSPLRTPVIGIIKRKCVTSAILTWQLANCIVMAVQENGRYGSVAKLVPQV